MEFKSILSAAFVGGTLSLASMPAHAAIVGGLDPATAPGVFESDSADTFMVISNQFTYTTNAAEAIDLGSSSFNYQSNANVAAAATPFLAIQGAGDIHDTANYDVIWVGIGLANSGSGTDATGALGAGSLLLPASSTIVGGFFGSAADTLSPVSAVFATGDATDVLVIGQSTVSVAGDIAVTGTNWSTTAAVTSREYHYQLDLQPIPEPGAGLLFGLAGIVVLLRRRR